MHNQAATTAPLQSGFDNYVLDSQACFRAALQAMSRPGKPVELSTKAEAIGPLEPATVALCLTLMDVDTSVWLDPACRQHAEPAPNLRFHCGCPLVDESSDARFGVLLDPAKSLLLERFHAGEDQYPDRSATLICQVDGLWGGPRVAVSGPGVDRRVILAAKGLPEDFESQWEANHASYPLGVDLFLTSCDCLVGLPRSVTCTARRPGQED